MKPYRFVSVFFCTMCAAAFGLTNVYWNGGESGDWDDPNNWSPKQAPVDATYCAILTPRTKDTVINVSGNLTVGQVLFGVTGEKQTDEDYFPMITIKGPGSITTTTGCYIYNKRRCCFDNFTFSPLDFWHPDATNYVISLRNGATLNHSYFVHNENGVIDIEDSTLNCGRFNFGSRNAIRIVNGEVNIATEIKISSVTNFIWDGGRIIAKYPISDPRLVPDRADETLVMTSPQNYIEMPAGPGTVYDLVGKMVQTNSTHSGGAIYSSGYTCWRGGGEMYAEWFRFPYQTRTELALSKMCIGRQIYANTSHADSRIDIHGGIEFGAFGDWSSSPDGRVASIYLRGPITVNTRDCYDGETLHTIDLGNLYPRPTSILEATGGGVVTACVRSAICPFDAVVVTNGTRLIVKKLAKQPFLSQKLSVCASSTLELTAGTHPVEVFETPYIDPTATVLVNLPASPVSGTRYPILSTSSTNEVDISRFVLNAANPGAWRIAESFGRVYLTDDAVVATAFDYEWTGAVNGNWSEPGNWANGVVPNASDARVAFRSGNQIVVTNDVDGLKVYNIRFDNGGPFTLFGKAITIAGTSLNSATNDAIYVCGGAPATIVAPIKGINSNWMSFKIDYDSCLNVLGNVSSSYGFSIIGDVRFGGAVTVPVLYTYGTKNNSRATRQIFLAGSSKTVSNQSQPNLGGSYWVAKGAEIVLKGGYEKMADPQHFVDGTLDFRAPVKYSSKAQAHFDGPGLLCIGKPVSHPEGNGTTLLGTGITLRPGARWNTVTSDAADKYVRLGVDSFGTLSITNDFAYGPEPGLETTTTAADRALQLPRPACTLTVDTQDPISGEGHTATFEDPIIGYGKLVKRGAGTLVFASAENAITGGVEIAEGAFTWTAPQTLQKLSFGPGARIVFPESALSLTVEKGLDLTGAVIDLSAVPSATFGVWTPILETSGPISGTPVFSVPGRFRTRLVEDGEGGVSLEVRALVGTQFILR